MEVFSDVEEIFFPYEYIDSWQKFNETSFPDKKEFIINNWSFKYKFSSK